MGWYQVAQGDCMNSIAKDQGYFWSTLWNAAENADLKKLRGDPDILLEGDKVFLPDLVKKKVSDAAGARYTFLRKGVPAMLRLQLLDPDHKPRSNMNYVLTVDGVTSNGVTDAKGMVVHSIPPGAQGGTLDLDTGTKTIRYPLKLGHLNPDSDVSGVQHRLKNLGYPIPTESGAMDDHTVAAIKQLQQDYDLPMTGEADDATKAKLKQIHGG